MVKNKILILQDTLSNYNEPVYKILSEKYNLTLAYANKIELKNTNSFQLVKLDRFKFLNIFYFKKNFYKFCNEFDVVIFSADLHYFSFCILPFIRSRKYKTIAWTIGIRASYSLRYNLNRKKNLFDLFYYLILKKCDALIFYMQEPMRFWGKMLASNKIFIAHNTIDVNGNLIDSKIYKNKFLFIGTLYKEKKIYELINAFIIAYQDTNLNKMFYLEIIGDGPEFKNIESYISEKNLSNVIKLRGKIVDDEELSKSFNDAILCISPDQAGLSVLMSMGYGVPYVTRSNSITGGERLNIIDNYNGLYYNTNDQLVQILKRAYYNPEIYLKMGNNARSYYLENATINIMSNGFINAIKYVTN